MRLDLQPGGGHLRLDRTSALDLAAFVVGGVDLSPGSAIPSDGDPRIDHALQGFFFTCGPEHIRHPEPAGDGQAHYPLHGSMAGTAVPPSACRAEPGAVEARFEVPLADGGTAEIERRWSVGADGWVALSDRVTNVGPAPFSPMCMYHINLAGRLLGEDTVVAGLMLPGGMLPWRFGEGESAHVCLPAAGSSSAGEARILLGPIPGLKGRMLEVRYPTDTLPFFQMWRCQRDGADVLSLEPVSHRIAKRPALEAAGELPLLQPGGSIAYRLAFRIIDEAPHGGTAAG